MHDMPVGSLYRFIKDEYIDSFMDGNIRLTPVTNYTDTQDSRQDSYENTAFGVSSFGGTFDQKVLNVFAYVLCCSEQSFENLSELRKKFVGTSSGRVIEIYDPQQFLINIKYAISQSKYISWFDKLDTNIFWAKVRYDKGCQLNIESSLNEPLLQFYQKHRKRPSPLIRYKENDLVLDNQGNLNCSDVIHNGTAEYVYPDNFEPNEYWREQEWRIIATVTLASPYQDNSKLIIQTSNNSNPKKTLSVEHSIKDVMEISYTDGLANCARIIELKHD